MLDVLAQFRDAIQAAGLIPPDDIEPDGALHRFPSNGKRNDDAGWYVLHDDDIPAGTFGCWRGGVSETWRANIGRSLTATEQVAHRAKVQAMQRARDDAKAREQAEAAKKAEAIWNAARPAPEDHPYLVRKDIKTHGARLHNDRLIVPLRIGGEIHSLQFIPPDGDKKFLTGGRVQGCYFSIGNPKDAAALCIAEGFATGATIHEATGYPVVIAFNAGNLGEVAKAMRERFADLPLILCADDDAARKDNPGITKATEAALSVGGKLAIPDFGTDRPDGATDFNDLHQAHGLEAVKRAVAGAKAPPRAEHQTVAWPDPSPLPEEHTHVEAFDFTLLPDSIAGWIEDISDRVQCPPDFPAVSAVAALATVLGRKLAIYPKQFDDWHEVANLWGCVVGPSGVLKTPAIAEALRPLKQLEAGSREKYETELAEWQLNEEVAKVKRDAARSIAFKAAKKNGGDVNRELLRLDPSEDKPSARRLIVNDCSVEALGEILIKNPNGVLAHRDELIGLLKSLDKEGNEGARSFFLSSWTGKEPYTFDRIGRGLDLRIEACCLSLLGSIQPSVFASYLRSAVMHAGHDGLLARFQLLVWPDISKNWKNVDRLPDTTAKQSAFAAFAGIDTAIFSQNSEGGTTLPHLRYSPQAQERFNDWRENWERRLRSNDDHPALIAHLSKYRKLVPALSLILQIADKRQAENVSDEALLRALAWSVYLESHARRAYASVSQPDLHAAKALLARIRSGSVSSPFALKDVYNKGWMHLAEPEVVRKAAEILEDYDYVISERILTLGRPKVVYTVNPKALTQ